MAKVNIVRPGEGEILGSGAQQIRILENGEHTDHRLGFAEVTLAPGFPSPLQHRHAQHDEGFYVLSGTIRFTVGQDEHRDSGLWRRDTHLSWLCGELDLSNETNRVAR